MEEFLERYKAPLALFIFFGFLIFIIISLSGVESGVEIDTKSISEFLSIKVKDSTLGDIAKIGVCLVFMNYWFK